MLLIVADAFLLPMAVWFSFWLQLAQPFPPQLQIVGWWLIPQVCIWLDAVAASGQYKSLHAVLVVVLFTGNYSTQCLTCVGFAGVWFDFQATYAPTLQLGIALASSNRFHWHNALVA